MRHDKDAIHSAREQGMFDSNMDPSILALDDAEKQKLSKQFSKAQGEMTVSDESPEKKSRKREKKEISLDVELTFVEKIVSFFLSVLGIRTREQFKMKKVIRNVEKEIAHIKPPIYNPGNKTITKYFAFKIHDLYLKLVWLKRIFGNTLENEKQWNNPTINKTIVERLFERLANLNTKEMDSNFSPKGIETVVSQFTDTKKAIETIEKNLYTYVYSIDKSTIDKANQIYTNMIYFKNLTQFDFISFFRRFDSTYQAGTSPNFSSIPGDALLPYLKQLEEAILQIDLSLDNIHIFKVLNDISNMYQDHGRNSVMDETEIAESPDTVKGDKLEAELIVLFEVLKELMYQKYLTLLIQITKQDPLYSPSIVHTRYDLFKIYLETFEKRIKTFAVKFTKERKKKKIEEALKNSFDTLLWTGIYSQQIAEKIDEMGYLSFSYAYHVAIINTFIEKYYTEFVKSSINILLLNGSFTEKNFHKLVSETFYSMDKFVEKFRAFSDDVKDSGPTAKRLMNLLSKSGSFQHEHKKMTEKHVVTLNGKAKDLFDEFVRLFNSLKTILRNVFNDIDSKPPKYVRNIRGIGGFRNVKFLQAIEKSNTVLGSMDDILQLLSS